MDLSVEQENRMRKALLTYGVALAEEYEQVLEIEDLESAGLPTPDQCRAYGNHESRTDAFNSIESYVTSLLKIHPDRLVAAVLRDTALGQNGLELDGSLVQSTIPVANSTDASPENVALIDCEIVAIYW
jgi:hypothetical protein